MQYNGTGTIDTGAHKFDIDEKKYSNRGLGVPRGFQDVLTRGVDPVSKYGILEIRFEKLFIVTSVVFSFVYFLFCLEFH